MEYADLEKEAKESSPVFNQEAATLLLPVNFDDSTRGNLAETADSNGLLAKTEGHITIIGRATGEAIIEKIKSFTEEEKEKILAEIENLSAQFGWSYDEKSDYYLVFKAYPATEDRPAEERKSIVQIINLPSLTAFYQKLNELLGTDFDVPFPHITLFTNSTREDKKFCGIGIYSKAQFEELKPERIDLGREVAYEN